MSYWPFVTIFISLLLILFFRRIDKRRINFNKFKRYAEKLSEDFNAFLGKKREEFTAHLAQLDATLKRAEALVSRIEVQQGELGKSQTKLQNEKNELDSVKRELEKLKGIKNEISGEAIRLGRSLPSLKSLSRKVDKITLDIAENEKALRNASALIPSIEKRIQERSEKAFDDVSNQILDEARNMFGNLIDDYRQKLQLLKETGQSELERFKKETQDTIARANQSVTGFIDTVHACQDKITDVEEGKLKVIEKRIHDLSDFVDSTKEKIERIERETMESFSTSAEDEYRRYVLLLEESQSSFKDGIFEKVEHEAKELSAYVARLEGRIQGLFDNIKEETDKYGEVLNLKAKAHESEADVLKNRIISEINEEANKNLLLIKPIVTEMNEKLLAYKKEFNALYSQMRKKLESQEQRIKTQIDTFSNQVDSQRQAIIKQLSQPIQEAKGQIEGIREQLEDRIGKATSTVSDSFIDRLKEYESIVRALEGRIGDLKNIANTGQEMIEERIDSVFRNYQPEIEQKIRSLKEETETIYKRERERIIEKIGTIIRNSDAELEKREQQIAAYLEEIEQKFQGSEKKIREHENAIMDSVNKVKLEAREELIRELENLKAMFTHEKERSIGRFKEDLAGIHERIEAINGRIGDLQGLVEGKIKEALSSVDGNFKEIETNYLKTEDQFKEKLMANMDGIHREVESMREEVDNLKEELVTDVNNALEYFRNDVEKEISGHRDTVYEKGRELQDLVNSITEGAKSELEQSQKEASDSLRSFSVEIGEVQDGIEHRVADVEKRISDFEKESTVLKRALRFKERVEQDIERFSDIIVQLREDKKDILSLQKVIENLKRDEGDISAKVRQLKSEKKLVQDIAKNAEQAIGLITVVDEKIKLIESERELLDKIESGMRKIEEQFDAFKEKAGVLESREKDIEISIETITKTKEFLSNLEQRTDLLKDSFSEIRDHEEDLKKKISRIDEKTGSILNYENRIEEVLSKFKEMDSFVTDIEERSKQLQSAREWLARVESRLTNLTRDAERLVDELKSAGAGTPASIGGRDKHHEGRPTVLSKESESKVKTVLTLFEQKWTIPEICKVTKMSRGEVELILELNNR